MAMMAAPTRASSVVDDLARALPSIDLTELMARAELQTRYDTKYIVYPSVLRRLLLAESDDLEVLEIGGRRQFAYSSTYFDTPDLRTYRDHVQGRRRRYKVRTRSYVDSASCALEVKLSGIAGASAVTDKHRAPHPFASATVLTDPAREVVSQILSSSGLAMPADLCPSVTTSYRRTTFVGRQRPIRLTVDADLDCHLASRRHESLRDRVLIEVKSESPRDPLVGVLRRLGARPLSVSKYCVGAALLVPGVPTAPWRPVLRRHFGLTSPR